MMWSSSRSSSSSPSTMPARTGGGISRAECGTWRITGEFPAPGRRAKEAAAAVMGRLPGVVGGTVRDQGGARGRTRLRPGRARAGRGGGGKAPEGQLRDASASFHVVDGRMTAAALAGSGW
ncbi:hypothetical protein GCM10027072_70640 [Streptomyces bullii]